MNQPEIRLNDRHARFGAWRARLSLISAPIFAWLLAGCVSDTTLLQENSAIAQRSARLQARSDLQCAPIEVSVLSELEVPESPWGYLYSDYRIRADGCGRSAVYTVECRDERLCDVTRETK